MCLRFCRWSSVGDFRLDCLICTSRPLGAVGTTDKSLFETLPEGGGVGRSTSGVRNLRTVGWMTRNCDGGCQVGASISRGPSRARMFGPIVPWFGSRWVESKVDVDGTTMSAKTPWYQRGPESSGAEPCAVETAQYEATSGGKASEVIPASIV